MVQNSTIKVFPSLLIDKFPLLTKVFLYGVGMTSFVSPVANCAHLTIVELTRNLLTKIPQSIFKKCTNIEYLYLGSKLICLHYTLIN